MPKTKAVEKTTAKPTKKEPKVTKATKATKTTKVTKKKNDDDLKDLEDLANQDQDWDASEDETVEESEEDNESDNNDDETEDEDEDVDVEDVDVEDNETEDEDEEDSVEEVTDDEVPPSPVKNKKGRKMGVVKNDTPVPSTLRNRVSVVKEDFRSNVKAEGASYGKRTVQSVSSFSYNDYRNSDTSLGDADMTDLLRTAIAKAHDAGQQQLKNVLFHTLKATKLECDWPQLHDNRRGRFNNNNGNNSNNGRGPKFPQKDGSREYGKSNRN